MSIVTSLSSLQKSAIELKSSAFNVPALMLASSKLADIKQELQTKISQAPDFFKNSPLLIDCHELTKQNIELDLSALIKALRSLHFIPIAISGASVKQNVIAIELGIAVQSTHNLNHSVPQISEKTAPTQAISEVNLEAKAVDSIIPPVENKLITQPIRSGQRVYAKGDLTILAPVNPGAEIMAEGNIHVYAPLRGRALAGVQGNIKSYIFCSDLQAELISIAGIYQLNEDLDKNLQHKLVQIYLHDQSLLIKKL
jgi:septum site-determining protein MinC